MWTRMNGSDVGNAVNAVYNLADPGTYPVWVSGRLADHPGLNLTYDREMAALVAAPTPTPTPTPAPTPTPSGDSDGDGIPDILDPDDDNDGVLDTQESGCGTNPLLVSSVTPERIDGAFAGVDDDGDTQIDEALPAGAEAFDCDGDGFVGSIESAIGTEPQAGCPDPGHSVADGWPLDNTKDGVANVSDVLAYRGKMPGAVPPQPKRLDLENNNSLNVSDVLKYKGKIPSVCN
jgi:hypothetical protein